MVLLWVHVSSASPHSLAAVPQAGFQSPLFHLPRALVSEKAAQLWPPALEWGRPVPNAVEDKGSQGTEISEEENLSLVMATMSAKCIDTVRFRKESRITEPSLLTQ